MNWKTWFPLILAIVLGVVAAKTAHDWVQKNKTAQTPNGQFVKIVVAKADTQPGKELTAEDLKLTNVDAKDAPTSGFRSIEEVVGRVNESFMSNGETVVESMLAPKGAGSGLQAMVPEGYRAVTIEVNEFSGVAGLLSPGCHVDIVSTMQGVDNGQVTKTICQDLKITAVGQRTAAAGGDAPPAPNEMFKSVTLLAKPEQVEAIELACSTGRPRLALRGGRDNAIVATAGISLSEMRGEKKKDDEAAFPSTQPAVAIAQPTTMPAIAVAIAKEPPHRTVKVIRGGQESIVTLPVLDGVPASADAGTDPSEQPGANFKDPFEEK